MQIKSIMRYHPTPVRMATIKNQMLVCLKREPFCTVVGNINKWLVWKNSTVFPQKLKNRITIWIRNSTLGYLSEENGNTNLKSYMHSHVHCSIIYSSQDMETTLVFINRQMDKEIVAYIYIYKHRHTYTMEYFSVIKRMKVCHVWQNGWILRTLCHYAKRNKSNWERQILCNLSYTWNLEKKKATKIMHTENILVITRGRGCGSRGKL